MTLKEELEILRGEPIKVFDGDPMDIPCIETSDIEKLCKQPIVSVQMVTYNHESFIRQAIDGVMMQRTDFEFELVIGEDASQDKTREICFEYQKKYPDKIRVLWWHENVSKVPGGNSRRVRARSRGDFFAFCEGDDYWIDPLKLQKQFDYIRETDSVMCVANSEWHYPDGTMQLHLYGYDGRTILPAKVLFDKYFHTSTYLIKKTAILECNERFPEILFWYDKVLAVCLATCGKVCFIPDVVSVYDWHGSGTGGTPGSAKRAMLVATQYVQLALCHETNVADFFFGKAIRQLVSMIAPYPTPSETFSCEEIRRFKRIVRDLYFSRYGWIGRVLTSLLLLKYSARARILPWYLRHPKLCRYWRAIKRHLHHSPRLQRGGASPQN